MPLPSLVKSVRAIDLTVWTLLVHEIVLLLLINLVGFELDLSFPSQEDLKVVLGASR
jgi:hypothetical protein